MREGAIKKGAPRVSHLSFNDAYAHNLGIDVRYLTERAVLALRIFRDQPMLSR